MTDYKSVLDSIQRDARYQTNLDWGQPRSGHPEGTVRAHIEELERNLKRLRPKLSGTDHDKLKVLIHVHDTFKAEAKAGCPITDSRSHASLAKNFLAEFCAEPDLLAMVQYHDEPYALWRQNQHGRLKEERVDALVAAIADWNLFLAFLLIDGNCAGKDRGPLKWIFMKMAGRVKTVFSAEDIV